MATYVPDATNASEPVGTRPISTAAPEFRALKQRVNQLITGMGKNKIINGKMEIAQRGTSFAAANNYTLDRWLFTASGGSVATVSQGSSVVDNEFQRSLNIQVTAADTSIAAGDFVILKQVVEGFNINDLFGRTFTLSFRVRSSKAGTHCVALRNSVPDRSYIATFTVNVANTWESKSITVTGGLTTAGTWDTTNGPGLYLDWVLAAGSNWQSAAGSWQAGNFLATSAQVNCMDTVGNIFAITGVQLEAGPVATPFEHRPFGAELALAQRYHETGTPIQIFSGYVVSGEIYYNPVRYCVTKRATPTVVAGAVNGVSLFVHRFPTTPLSTSSVNVDGFATQATATSTGSGYYQYSWTASSEL